MLADAVAPRHAADRAKRADSIGVKAGAGPMDDKIMLVTGGSRGIGAATARMAVARGYDVCVNFQGDAEAAEAVVRDIEAAGRRGLAVKADIGREDEVERLFETLDSELGSLTALVGSAGLTGHHGRLDEVDGDTLRRVVEVNVLGMLYCCRAAVRRMSSRHGGRGGNIVALSSGSSTLGAPDTYVWYAASKGAVDSLVRGLALEVAREGIRVNGVAPGFVRTDIHANAGLPDRLESVPASIPMGYAAEPEEIAEAILWLLSGAAGYVTGEILRVTGGR